MLCWFVNENVARRGLSGDLIEENEVETGDKARNGTHVCVG
jgi:hypothetical protein